MNTQDVHQVEITCVDHLQADKALVLKGRQALGSKAQIVFTEVVWWELCSFGIQNVLSSIEGYGGDSLTDALVVEHDIPQSYSQSVRAGQYKLFVLNEQVGLSGWVIATDVQVHTDQ